jgi:hypothetical protein
VCEAVPNFKSAVVNPEMDAIAGENERSAEVAASVGGLLGMAGKPVVGAQSPAISSEQSL